MEARLIVEGELSSGSWAIAQEVARIVRGNLSIIFSRLLIGSLTLILKKSLCVIDCKFEFHKLVGTRNNYTTFLPLTEMRG